MASPLADLALLFFRLGVTSFGGPAVHIAMMEDEVVARRRWMSREDFLDLVGATNLIPGPNSTEMAIHIGHQRAGWPGLLVAGLAFIVPASVIVTCLAWGYVRFGGLPAMAGVLYGVKPVVLAIVLQALWRLGRTAVKTWLLAMLAALSAGAALAGVNEILILAAAGALVLLARRLHGSGAGALLLFPVFQAGATASVPAPGLWALFTFFAKIGSVLFGSGYVLVAFLHGGLVIDRGWLTESQLLDAIAIGQITPGPLSTTATFIGYLLAGGAGALAATIGMFLPAFVFVALSAPLVPRLRRSAAAAAMLDGINVASLALMAVVLLRLASSGVTDGVTIALAAVSAVLLLGFGVNSGWLVLAGAVLGLLVGG